MTMRRKIGAIGAGVALSAAGVALAQEDAWRVVNPSSTGVPGEAVGFARFAPDGRLWVSARWPFWGEGGIGIYDFATDSWETYANWSSPIPSQFVNDLAFDGPVAWLATGGGLVRFDGAEWTVYNAGNSPLLHGNVADVSIAPNGDVWVNNSGSQQADHAIFRFDGETWTAFQVGAELPWDLPWDELSDVLVDADGHAWVTNSVLNGVAEYDGATWTLHGAGTNRFGSMMEDLDGNIWLVAGVGGGNAFYKFDGSTFTTFTPANTPFVNTTIVSMATDDDGAVLVGNWAGQVIRTTDGGASWSEFTTQNQQIYSIAPDPGSDDVWVSTPGAVRHIGSVGQWIEAFNSYNTGLPDYFIDDIIGATDGKVWFASAEAGLSSFDGTRWSNWGSHNPNREWPVGADGAVSVYEDASGEVWFGSNGVGRLDDGIVKVWDWTNSALPVDEVVGFATDPNGDLWIGTDYTAVFRFTGTDWESHMFAPFGWTANEVQAMASDLDGNLWVGTFTALHRFDGQSWTEFDYLDTPLFDASGATALAPALDGGLWVGSNNGLGYFDGATFTVYTISNSPLPANPVQGIAVRPDGLLAVSSMKFGAQTPFPNGVSVIDGDIDDPASWTVHTYQNSPLPHYQLGEIAFDTSGDLWVSAISEGVAVLTPAAGCAADFNGDGALNILDFVAFQNAFQAGDAGADANGDGVLNILDFVAFQNQFQAGC